VTLEEIKHMGMMCLVGNWGIHWLYHSDYWYLFSNEEPIIPDYSEN
jgi:hypothetical protein